MLPVPPDHTFGMVLPPDDFGKFCIKMLSPFTYGNMWCILRKAFLVEGNKYFLCRHWRADLLHRSTAVHERPRQTAQPGECSEASPQEGQL